MQKRKTRTTSKSENEPAKIQSRMLAAVRGLRTKINCDMPEVLKFLMTERPDPTVYLSARNVGLSASEAENAACVYARLKN